MIKSQIPNPNGQRLNLIYKKLYANFGPQHWWPANNPFEVIVGAILTQNTSWKNVEKAIENLKQNKTLNPKKLYNLADRKLAKLIKPAGFYNLKAKRLKEFLNFFFKVYQGSLRKMSGQRTAVLRNRLLAVNGIGPETADSILLYCLDKPVFVVDAYTKRIFLRHRLIKKDATYDEVQNLFMKNLKKDVKLFNEYHALLVKLGKDICLKRRPKCDVCPLKYQIANIKYQK
jgi:endonuclease-3 related protein